MDGERLAGFRIITWAPEAAHSPDALILRADKTKYENKTLKKTIKARQENGKNEQPDRGGK